jgi:autotransporter translocation and assembly factor TamB
VNLGIDITGNFVVSSSPLDLANNFKITLMGNLHIILEPPSDAVQIAGHMETVSGKYASWNQNFDIQNGTIDFKNPKEINPEVNLLAVKKIGKRMFEVAVTGTLNDMDQNIRVTENDQELDMSYLDKIALLTLGADLGQISTKTDSTLRNVGEQVATTSVLTAVERGAEKYVGLDKVEINSSQSILDLERMRLNNGLQDASISFGKYLTSDLYVEYKTQFGGNFPTPKLSWDAGNRIGLQYRINRYWSLDSFYEKTQRGNNIIQLGIKWELTF